MQLKLIKDAHPYQYLSNINHNLALNLPNDFITINIRDQ